MDPNANYAEQLLIAENIAEGEYELESELTEATERLAELILAMRNWLASGGFPPDAFKPK